MRPCVSQRVWVRLVSRLTEAAATPSRGKPCPEVTVRPCRGGPACPPRPPTTEIGHLAPPCVPRFLPGLTLSLRLPASHSTPNSPTAPFVASHEDPGMVPVPWPGGLSEDPQAVSVPHCLSISRAWTETSDQALCNPHMPLSHLTHSRMQGQQGQGGPF